MEALQGPLTKDQGTVGTSELNHGPQASLWEALAQELVQV